MFKLLGSINNAIDHALDVKVPNVKVQPRQSFWIDFGEGRVYYGNASEALEDLMQRYNELADAYGDLLARYESGH